MKEQFRTKAFVGPRVFMTSPLEGKASPQNAGGNSDQVSARNSYSSIMAATAKLAVELPLSTRTTWPLQRTRMLSVSVISGGRVRVKSMADPLWMLEST